MKQVYFFKPPPPHQTKQFRKPPLLVVIFFRGPPNFPPAPTPRPIINERSLRANVLNSAGFDSISFCDKFEINF